MFLSVVDILQHRLKTYRYSHKYMEQSNGMRFILGLADRVDGLHNATATESHTSEDLQYCLGKHEAYGVVYHLIRRTLDLDETEFKRQIDEARASDTLHLKEDGMYELLYREGQIVTLKPITYEESRLAGSSRKGRNKEQDEESTS